MVTKIMSKSKNKTKFKSRKKKSMKKKINNKNTKLRSMKGGSFSPDELSPAAKFVMKRAAKNPNTAVSLAAKFGRKELRKSGVDISGFDPNKIVSGAAGDSDPKLLAEFLRRVQEDQNTKIVGNQDTAAIIKQYETQNLINKLKQSQGQTSKLETVFAGNKKLQSFALKMAANYGPTVINKLKRYNANTNSFIKGLSTQSGLPPGFGKKLASSLSAPPKTTGLGGPVSGFKMPSKIPSSSSSSFKFKP